MFLPHGDAVPSRKRWLGLTARPKGTLVVDAGAKRAIVEKGRSLLPVGVLRIDGDFAKGDLVSVADEAGVEIARGLTNYSSDDAAKLKGLPTDRTGVVQYEELIHRDNLAVME